MHFRRALFLGLSALAAHAAAQSRLAFTSTPSSVTAGESAEITWAGGSPDQPVTILLKQGSPGNLDTVETLTSSATGGSFTWTPETSLPAGTDYALEIQQGSEVNYSGQFAYESDVPPSLASSASSAISSVSASASSATASISSALSSQISSVVSSIAASLNSSSTSLSTTTLTRSATLPTGTGTTVSRNTTMVSPTLSGTTSTQTTTTGTGSGTAPSASQTGAAVGLSSPLALVLGAVVAMIYLQ